MNIKIYSTPSCVYCRMAKEYFKKNNISYEEKDVQGDMAAREEMIEKSHQMGVPVIDIDGRIIVGFNRPEIDQILGL
ncbi:MAG: glutaredoxin domain-containing protein [bacterium]|nr:glutaredoxin domain-containing protein [bacterium]